MSLKQRGNQAFKGQKYKQAIKLYDQYVSQQHPDNKNAYFNMALCYSKLKDHQKSIEACKSALAIDPAYEKAYYRLMKEYFQVKNPYEIFINARLFTKNAKEQSSPEYLEAKEYMRLYKDYFINKLAKQHAPKKLEEKDQIFELIEPLAPIKSEDFNEQIDKYPNQWIEEWEQGMQSDEAKWVQIDYIIRELDYDTGISLAYFYLNQATTPAKRKDVLNRIREIKKDMNKEGEAVEDDACNNGQNLSTFTEPIELPLEQEQERPAISPPVRKNEKKEPTPKKEMSSSKQSTTQREPEMPKNVNKIQQLLEKKTQNKKIYEQAKQIETQLPPEKPKTQKKESSNSKKPQQPKPAPKPVQAKEQKPAAPAAKQQQRGEQQLQGLYRSYCGNLQKTKDIFVELYRSIFQILNGKQSATNMGKLLILIKKRVKKFKMIVASFSDNEQKAIFDLLSKKGMEEYAVDFAPKYHKI